jgi:hypothetical protein
VPSLLAFVVSIALCWLAGSMPTWPQVFGEALCWLALALAPLPRDWRGSRAWPAVIVLLAPIARRNVGLLLGLALVAVLLVRVLDDLVRPRPRAALLLVLLAVPVARVIVLLPVGLHPFARELRLPASPTADGPPILLVSIDTLRADDAATMASVTRLAAAGAYWPRAMSTASWTVPAMASLLTGTPPWVHGATAVLPGPRPTAIRSDVPTLAETLAARGYATAGFATNPLTSGSLGFERGFATFHHDDEDLPQPLPFLGTPPVPTPVDRAVAWLDDAPARGAFLWVHLADPHLPYAELPSDPADPLVAAVAGRWDLLAAGPIRAGQLALPPDARTSLRAVYRRQVARADAAVQRLLAAADTRWPDAIVVLTADHGEEFWDHGGFEHGHSHHGEVLDVPLVIRGPGMAVATRTDVASLADVAPTLLAMVGVPGEVDLRQPADRTAFALGNLYYGPGASAREGTRRAIVGVGEFDLSVDPEERSPLPPGPLTERAAAHATSAGAPVDVNLERLKRLGYVE